MGLDGVEIVMEVEERFAIRVDDDEAEAVVTVGDLRDLVAGKRPDLPIAEVWERVCAIVVEQLGAAPESVVPEARFIEDLGMD